MQLAEETRFFGCDFLQIAGVEPHAAAVEHLSMRTLPKGISFSCIPHFGPLSRELSPLLYLLSPEIRFFVLAGLLNHVVLLGETSEF